MTVRPSRSPRKYPRRTVDADALLELRSEFPVLARVAYLNTGTDGPVPWRAVEAAGRELRRQAEEGRSGPHSERRAELKAAQRDAYAALLGCPPADVALTTSTSEGLATVLAGLGLGPGDEVVTSDQEHPGLLGPLAELRSRGVAVRVAPLARVADAAGPETRLVACSHVGWWSGEVAPAELADLDVPVLLDGAQGVGAVAVDVEALGCAAYAGSGQKWLCGPDGTGMLYLRPSFRDSLGPIRASYETLADPGAGLDAAPWPDARRFDAPALPAESSAFALASLDLLRETGLEAVRARARELARRLAAMLVSAGREVAPRGDTSLVAWSSADPRADRDRLAAEDVIVRDIPGTRIVRASVGAWTSEEELERLAALVGGS
jgi:selenocysteine lyase/cysteine desulfurase